jgi:sterol desaturase/sphingolipid hydroxylase (fatty acid hydroxylase superfamily)
MIILSLKGSGNIDVYGGVGEYGLWYIIYTIVLLLFLNDARFYWFHRLMHHPRLYKYVHAVHHASLDINPFTSFSFHIVESVVLTLWILPLAMIMPLSLVAL